jgi:hypothetical protein
MSTKKPIIEPVCQIRAKGLIMYKQLVNREDFATPETKFEKGRSRQVYTGQVTNGAKKRIKKAIQTLVAISKPQVVYVPQFEYDVRFRLTFITLTLPSEQGNITDKQIISGPLQKFLRESNRKNGMKHYIWKAERQKNGNIHFHITTNVFIHYQVVQDRWNNEMKNIGLMENFTSKFGHSNPHSTEIKAVRRIDQIERYLQKYYMKTNQYDEIINGKLWDCSLSLKSIPWPKLSISTSVFDRLNEVATQFPDQIIELDQCSLIWFHEWQRKAILNDVMSIEFNKFLEDVRNFQRTKKVPAQTSTIA